MRSEQRPQRSTTDVEQRDECRGRFGTPWFARRNHGWGYRPATWQGWALAGLLVVLLYVGTTALAYVASPAISAAASSCIAGSRRCTDRASLLRRDS